MEINESRARQTLIDMLAIPGRSGEETAIAEYIVAQLLSAGVSEDQIFEDSAHHRSPLGGRRGNLIVHLPGTLRLPRRLLMAHIDTVPLCVGSQPVEDQGFLKSADPETALGGDNRAGAAVVLLAALTLLEQKLPHPPLTLLWPVQEEVGLIGARYVDQTLLAEPELCFNWDGGAPNVAVIGATGADYIDITVRGIASHAGAHPEDGVSAAIIAAKALADLQTRGWHGLIEQGGKTGTSNVGSITGGEATNVVMNHLTISSEIRSHDREFRRTILGEWEAAFDRAVETTVNAAGETGSVRFDVHHKYESFELSPEAACVRAALRAVDSAGLTPETRIANGGLDANWLTAHGFGCVTLGCGQAGIHTVQETLHLGSFYAACRVALLLATAQEAAAR